MKTCPYCSEQIQNDAVKCRYCGEWLDGRNETRGTAQVLPYYYGYEYKSEAELFGLPLIHIAQGINPQTGAPRVAKGIIAIGNIALGGFALGGIAIGGFTLGGLSIGVISLGGAAIGVLVALGGFAFGGAFAVGGLAISLMYAIGGLALAPHYLGGNGIDPAFLQQIEKLFAE